MLKPERKVGIEGREDEQHGTNNISGLLQQQPLLISPFPLPPQHCNIDVGYQRGTDVGDLGSQRRRRRNRSHGEVAGKRRRLTQPTFFVILQKNPG